MNSGGAIQSGRIESSVEIQAVYERLRSSIRGVIVGKDRVVDLCLIALLALIGPRVALVFTWIFSGMIGRAIDSWLVAVLGFLFLPWTTLAYVVFYDVGAGREVVGFEWFLVGLAFLVDLGSYVGGRRARE